MLSASSKILGAFVSFIFIVVLVASLTRVNTVNYSALIHFQNDFVLNTEDSLATRCTHVVKTLFRIKHSHITCSVFNLFYIPQEM